MNTSHITCFGELLLRLSSPGRELLLQTPSLAVHIGGAEANVAVSLRQLEHRTAMISAVADNALGQAVLGELRRRDVDVGKVFVAPGRMGIYFLTHGSGHRPADVLYDRADSVFAKLDPSQYDWPRLLKDTRWLHVSGITPAVSDNAARAAIAAMNTARAQGIRMSFDCNFRSKLWGHRAASAPATLRELAGTADLLFGDRRDIALMFGAESATEATAFNEFPHLQWLAATIRRRDTIDTQELAGQVHTRDGVATSRYFTMTNIVDRIGSGDAFAAGVIDQVLQNAAPQRMAEFGCAAAVLKHSIPGDFNLSTRMDIESLLGEQTTDVRR